MKENELLKLLFETIDKIEYEFPQLRNEALERLCKIYDKDMTSVVSAFINYNWAKYDNIDGNKIINDFLI